MRDSKINIPTTTFSTADILSAMENLVSNTLITSFAVLLPAVTTSSFNREFHSMSTTTLPTLGKVQPSNFYSSIMFLKYVLRQKAGQSTWTLMLNKYALCNGRNPNLKLRHQFLF